MTDRQPEPPNHTANWLQRLWQRLQPKPGDTITTEIGENAQHVAVGKNIFQIIGNTFNIPTPLVITIAVSAIIIAGVVIRLANYGGRITARLEASPTPTLTPSQTPLPTATPTLTPTTTPSPTPTLFAAGGLTETLVVVADFLNPQGQDPSDVTFDLVDKMRETLAAYKNVRVERLYRSIDRERGSDAAMKIGKQPNIHATIVIWGFYVPPSEQAQLTVHFDIVITQTNYLRNAFVDKFGPLQIQPSMFDFKIDLGNQLGQLTAFTAGLMLYNASQYKDAEPLFTTASQVVTGTLATDFAQTIHFYRGTNYLYLGRFLDAQSELEAALSNQPPAEHKPDDLYLSILNNIGGVYDALGENQKALDYYNQALPLQQQLGNKAGTLNNIGSIYATLGENQKALDYYNQALPIQQQVSDKEGEAATLNNIGFVYATLGENQKALDYYNQALPLQQQVNDKTGEATTLNNIGSVYDALGENQKALDYYNQALPIQQQVSDKEGEAATLANIGSVYFTMGNKQKALDYYNQALPLQQQVSHKATTLSNIGSVYADLGERQKALDYFNQALPLQQQVSDSAGEATTLNNIGGVYSKLGDKQKALEFYQRAADLFHQINDKWHEVTVRKNIALLLALQTKWDAAIAEIATAIKLAEAVNHPDLDVLQKLQQQIEQAHKSKAQK